MGYAFISYSSKNQQMADSFKSLFNQNGIETWMAPGDIPFGSTYTSTINHAIKESSCFVLLFSENAQLSIWVKRETERAVSYGKPVFPIMLDDIAMNDDFEFLLSMSQALAIRKIDKNDENIKRLLQAVITYTGIKSVKKSSSAPDENNCKIDEPSVSDNENYFTENAEMEGTVLKHFRGRLSTHVVIPEGVTVIGARAFAHYPELLGISLPSSVKRIDEYAFTDCYQLKSITVDPQNPVFRSEDNCCIERATNRLVFGCYCSQIPDGVAVIGIDAFWGCKNLKSITIPQSVLCIESAAFFECVNLERVTFENGLKKIGSLAFCDCHKLSEIEIPESVTEMVHNPFYKCEGLVSICVSPDNPVYHSESNCCIETNTGTLVCGCKNSTIPDGIVAIGPGAFIGCTGLKNLVLPASVKEIENCAFYGCKSLKSIRFPEGTERICTNAFAECRNVVDIYISSSVIEIEDAVFSYCTALKSIKVSPDNQFYYSEDDCCIRKSDDALAFGCMNSLIPDGVTEICGGAFYGCTALTGIYLPESVAKIGENAFSECYSLSFVDLTNGLKIIGERAFFECNDLTDIIIPGSVQYIGEYALAGCDLISRDIFCEASRKPKRWHSEWTDENSDVYWKNEWYYDEEGIPVIKKEK